MFTNSFHYAIQVSFSSEANTRSARIASANFFAISIVVNRFFLRIKASHLSYLSYLIDITAKFYETVKSVCDT